MYPHVYRGAAKMKRHRPQKKCLIGRKTVAFYMFRHYGRGKFLNSVSAVIKRKRISADQGRDFLVQLGTLNFKIDPPPLVSDFPRLFSLAAVHQLTAYDVAYLDLAKRLSLALATKDSDLRKAALAEGIQTL